MSHAAITPSLHAPDLEETIAFYIDVLGFSETGNWEEGGDKIWAELTRGEARLWLFSNALERPSSPVMSGLLYIFVDDVYAEAAALQEKVKVRWGPEDQPYGLRELGFEDPNGYLLVFAQDISSTAT